jgi:hypothetical protein
VFISSPGDVDAERSAAAALVGRLDREYRRFFSIEPYLWEQEPHSALRTFKTMSSCHRNSTSFC